MNIPKAAVSLLAKTHPHSTALLKGFTPLLDAQNTLAEELPPPVPPEFDRAAFALGKAWMTAKSTDPAVFCDEAFLRAAPNALVGAAVKGLPEIKDELRSLGKLIGKEPGLCTELAAFRLRGRREKVKAWAKKHEQSESASALLSAHLGGAAARRMAKTAAQSLVLPAWERGYCPICGSRPHAGSLKTKEGQRFLQCSLCRHEWRFSRTACPVCERDSLKDLPIFFLEDNPTERAEACEACKHYILELDMRTSSGDIPLELAVLCMMPLDLLMHEKGYTAAVEAE